MVFRERHTQIFLWQMAGIMCLAAVMMVLLIRGQEIRVRDMLYEHDAAVVSFLLDQGVPRETAARAVLSEEQHAAGEELLHRIGISEETDIRLVPVIREVCAVEKIVVSLAGTLFFILLFSAVFCYLRKTDRIYREAAAVVESYADNDFSRRLPEVYGGTLYWLFSRVNFMASELKAGKEAENRIKEFLKTTVSDISHQLKTPLAALSMYQEIILGEPERVETVIEFTQKAGAALARMEGLVSALLRITRLDAGNVVFSGKLFDASELAWQAVEGLMVRAGKEGKEIILSGDDRAKVFCDLEWSREALGNVVKNALDHTKKGERITLAWEQTPLMTRFTVTDNGEGIGAEDIHHIFKRFYRSRNAESAGAGLGLPLAKSILEEQGGTIGVESVSGEGAKFTLSFPAREKPGVYQI